MGNFYIERHGHQEAVVAIIEGDSAAASLVELRRSLELQGLTPLPAMCVIKGPAPAAVDALPLLQDFANLRGVRTGLSLVVPAQAMAAYLAAGADLAADGVVLGIFSDCEQAYALEHAVQQWALAAPRRAAAQLAAALLQRPAACVQEAQMPYRARRDQRAHQIASPG